MKLHTHRTIHTANMTLVAMTLATTSALAGGRGHHGGHGHGVPAPELGASAIGMALAAGIALYARRRGRRS